MSETSITGTGFEAITTLLDSSRLTSEVEVFLVLSALSFMPFFLVAITTFTRNIIVLSFLRHALGLQQSPPNIVLITLSIFLTLFVMTPIVEKSYEDGIKPYLEESISVDVSLARAWQPFRNFLISQTHESDLNLIYELAETELPGKKADIKSTYLIPAFLLSELKTAFKIGFIIYLPFLLIDIVMAAILMSLGMIMVPPITISLPLKIMLFVVVDGWALISETLIRSVVA